MTAVWLGSAYIEKLEAVHLSPVVVTVILNNTTPTGGAVTWRESLYKGAYTTLLWMVNVRCNVRFYAILPSVG